MFFRGFVFIFLQAILLAITHANVCHERRSHYYPEPCQRFYEPLVEIQNPSQAVPSMTIEIPDISVLGNLGVDGDVGVTGLVPVSGTINFCGRLPANGLASILRSPISTCQY